MAKDYRPYKNGKALRRWMYVCVASGPVSAMSRTYVPAVLQTVARALGTTSDGGKCQHTGNDCFLRVGKLSLHANSYVLYLKAVYTIAESIIALCVMSVGDYCNYRKWILLVCLAIYGILATPFSAFKGDHSSNQLIGLSLLYSLINICNTILQILEASFLPDFMRAYQDEEDNGELQNNEASQQGSHSKQAQKNAILKKGSKVSSLGLVMGNIGGIIALLIGIIVTYAPGRSKSDDNDSYLDAITAAGCLTFVIGVGCTLQLPSVKNNDRPSGWIVTQGVRRTYGIFNQIKRHHNAFLFCLAWVIWNLSFSSFMTVFMLLFRSTLGVGPSDKEYTIYSWLSYTLAGIGSLAWMWVYPQCQIGMKTWGYIFLSISLFTQFWGCLGIKGHTRIGFRHGWEFWLFEVIYSTSSSALRAVNRVLYSAILPEGGEVQYFGLEVVLGTMVNWGFEFLVALIQDRTGDERYPFVLNLSLVLISISLYSMVDIDKGMDATEWEPDVNT